MFKKFLSIILVLTMMLSIGVPAFASSPNEITVYPEMVATDIKFDEEIEVVKNIYNGLTFEQQTEFLAIIEELAYNGDESLVELHKNYIDSDYNFEISNAAAQPMVAAAASSIAGQLQALNLPSVVYYGLLAFATSLGVPVGNIVDLVVGLGLGIIIIANWDAIAAVWQDIIDIFVDSFGTFVMDAFYYLQGLVGVYTVSASGRTVKINGESYVCDTTAELVAQSMKRLGHTYYPAVRSNGAVLVAPVDIPRNAALAIMRLNSSYFGVFTIAYNYASSICQSLGGTVRGPEGESSSGYWMHYHSSKYPNAHCWYIG